jgi:protein required for attachment to host cells
MKTTWVLIADAHRARCLERIDTDRSLTELAAFVYPQSRHSGAPPAGDVSGDAGKGHGRTGHSGTQFEPHTDLRTKERREFARLLAKHVNGGVAAHACTALALIATGPMLGEIRPMLSHGAEQLLGHCVAADLTAYQGPELRARVDAAMQAAA